MAGSKDAASRSPWLPYSRRSYVRLTWLACSGSVAVIALLGLVGGLVGRRLVDSSLLNYWPMARSSAVIFLILGGQQLLRVMSEMSFPGRRVGSALHLAVGAATLLNLIAGLTSLDVGLLDTFFRHMNALSGVPHKSMSPATATLFLLSCASSWSLSNRYGRVPLSGLRMAGWLGAFVALAGGVFQLAYLYSAPLLYASSLVPMAQSTALVFMLLGTALVCEAGLELQPLRMFFEPSTRALLLRSFVPLVVGLSLAHSLAFGLGGPHFGQANAMIVASIVVGDALLVGLMVLVVAGRVGKVLEWAEALRSEAESRIIAALGEKTVLLKELHHRVKNNLQIVSSLLSLQADCVADPRDRVLFEESRARIGSMAMVHEDMCESGDLAFVDMNSYVRHLVGHLLNWSIPPVRIVYEMQDMRLPVTTSVPCGMILNELLMNAAKHAFPQVREPQLRVALGVEGGEVVLAVEDNGPGLPPGFSPKDGSTLGMLLAVSLAGQLHGQLTAENMGSGARFVLRFPLGEAEVPAPGPPA